MEKQFDIKILRLHWIKDDGKIDKDDLCAHGEVYLRIGNEVLSNKEKGSWTLSSTALYLMRTVNNNYKIDDYASQLIPCCGHTFMANADNKSAEILGCPTGIDWTIKHLENNQIKHQTQKGEVGIIKKEDYRKVVLKFVKIVERFYEESQPKNLPKDKYDREGYEAFWKEWEMLKKKIETKQI